MDDLHRFLRRPAVEKITGIPRSSLYDMIERNEFPRQVRLGRRMVGWIEAEVLEWQRDRIAERDASNTEAA